MGKGRAQAALGHDAAGNPIDGAWDKAGWILFFGGLFIAAWSTYGFETAVCYTREFKDPKRDTFKAIFYSGLVCLAVFILVPLSFQGALGLTGMLAPDIYSGMGVGKAMAGMLGGGDVFVIKAGAMQMAGMILDNEANLDMVCSVS